MSHVSAIVTFEAQPGKGDEVAALIAATLPKALQESPMPIWLVLQSEINPDLVYIVDVFTDATGRDAHVEDEAAKQIFATVPEHLAKPVNIAPMKLHAVKGL